MYNIAILASGSGSNAENIIRYFEQHPSIRVTQVLANKPDAYVLERAAKLHVPSRVFNKEEFISPAFSERLIKEGITHVVLAGFLWLVPQHLIAAFPDHMVNIHPALLPKYGGKGMYGSKVHESVIAAGETETGITIHLVNEEYDKGVHLLQAKCSVVSGDTADAVAAKVHELEYEHFPRTIENWIINTQS